MPTVGAEFEAHRDLRGLWITMSHRGPEGRPLAPREEGWAVLDAHRVQTLGFVTPALAKTALTAPNLHTHVETQEEVTCPSWPGWVC